MDNLDRLRQLSNILQDGVERERAELSRTGERPSQAYLRRARIAEYVADPDFWEAVRELLVVAAEEGQ